MGRLRIQISDGIYHVFARGADRRRIFVDHTDYERYISLLAAVVLRQGWQLFCFCLMPNHVHLMLQTPEPNLGNGMQWLHSRYALTFNERHGRIGHLFESPYKSPLIRTDAAFVRTVGYIVVNPVKAALCATAADWPWGSHAIVTDPAAPPAPWIAHNQLVAHLTAMTGASCYVELCATREREARVR